MIRMLSTSRVFVVALLLGLFALTARGVRDPDFWWHLRTGQYIAQTHSVPHRDIYSFTNEGRQWITHEWLSELIFYGIYLSTGFAGLIVLFGLIIGGAFALTYFRSTGRPYLAGLWVVLAALATAPTWGVRPQMFSLLLTSVFLFVLYRRPDTTEVPGRNIWWLVPLTLLWANLHAGYAVGLALIALAIVGWLSDAATASVPRDEALRAVRLLAILLVVCAAVVIFNPNGTHLYSYPFQSLHSRAMQTYIVEWASPDFHLKRFQPFLLLLFATFGALALSPRRERPGTVLLLIATAYAGMRSSRHIFIFALVAAPLLAKYVQAWLNPQKWVQWMNTPEKVPTRSKAMLNAALVLGMIAFCVARVSMVVSRQPATEAQNCPVAAVAFIDAQRPAGPFFNYYDWGGYFIWKLYPTYRVYVDGRADLYGDTFMNEFVDTYRAEIGWRKTFDNYQIQSALLPPRTSLAVALRREPGWKNIFEDKQAVVFTRSEPTGVTFKQVPPESESTFNLLIWEVDLGAPVSGVSPRQIR
ncbi:MAG: hypothetical protein DMG75_08065 [Acidobacteria bacterium]|nr:MAG: hypothetical protein DMG75_08065 [Acidobacteriota bacterium]